MSTNHAENIKKKMQELSLSKRGEYKDYIYAV